MIDALEGADTPVLALDRHEREAPGYGAVAAALAGTPDAVDCPGLAAFFRARGGKALSDHNGLSEAENRRLFVTPHVIEMVSLVLCGLSRVSRRPA